MELLLKRETFSPESTIGKLHVNGEFMCFVLEDAIREKKIPNITAIPAGRYEVAITYSNRFKQLMPLLMNVPNYEGVRIHWGNYAKDTEGCLLVGNSKGVNVVGNSVATYKKLFALLQKAIKVEKIFITIK